jgi:hypothetical protein
MIAQGFNARKMAIATKDKLKMRNASHLHRGDSAADTHAVTHENW